MVTERSICLDGKTCTAVISDEPEALLAAKAAGRAVVGVESERTGIWELKGIPYVIPDFEDATDELLDLVIRPIWGFRGIYAEQTGCLYGS